MGNSDFQSDYIQDCPDAHNPAESNLWSAGVPNDGQYCVTEPYDWSGQLAGWFPVGDEVHNGENITADVTPSNCDLFYEVWQSGTADTAEVCIVN